MGGTATGESGARANVPIGVEIVDFDDLDASLRYNPHAAVQTVQRLLPGMRARGWARIVNLPSGVVLGVANRTAYAAAKAATASFTRTWTRLDRRP
ncbi:SDR family NAD(P)-dependent oxidoreductase [Burkholderia dolosa]|uniref:SDR family NAD(P)-dependent oxidoreductase n=1 Tax=Burkholderia dolosa TaxID=152500 RepID=UPI003D15FB61